MKKISSHIVDNESLTISVISYKRAESFRRFYHYYALYMNQYDLLVIENSDVLTAEFSFTNTVRTFNKPLSHSLNQCIVNSDTRFVMICNDDIYFKNGIELDGKNYDRICTYCNWSCFVIDKAIIPEVGWFDMRYLDAGFDGKDYLARLKIHGKRIYDFKKKGLVGHDKTEHKIARWKYKQSGSFFIKKWDVTGLGSSYLMKALKPDELKKRKMIDEIDWFPYFTSLYSQGIWSDKIEDKKCLNKRKI